MTRKNELKGLPRLDTETQAFISTYEGFEKRFFENMRYYAAQEEAYEATERQYGFIMGRRKYVDYNSFRSVRNRAVGNRTKKSKMPNKPSKA